MNKQPLPAIPPIPTISPSLLTAFGSLRGGGQRMWKALYGAVWRYLWPKSRLTDVALCYAIPVALKQSSPLLHNSQWFTLSKLWLCSDGGAQAVNTRQYPMNGDESKAIKIMMGHSLLVRTSFDPAHPYLVRPSHINKTYISFTTAGIAYYLAVVDLINKRAQSDTIGGIIEPKE